MSDATRPEEVDEFVERVTETYVTAFDRTLDAQSEFVEAWTEAVEESMSESRMEEGYEGTLRAYEAWMDAAETSFDRMGDAVEGEEVDPDELRDVWLRAANDAFKETMSTTAFAAATGQSVGDVLDLRENAEEAGEETLHALGFASVGDVREVGERLVETERRLHAVEQKLDRVLDELA
jgi:cell division septum initiation protein DivIVA